LAAGGTYQLAYNGTTTKLEMVQNGKEKTLAATSPEMGVATLTGVAAMAPTLIPAALMNFNWGNPFGDSNNAKLEGQETIAGALCHKVTITVPQSQQTFWVDTQSFLLRRYRREQDSTISGSMPSIAVH